jgi:hypothetical protein
MEGRQRGAKKRAARKACERPKYREETPKEGTHEIVQRPKKRLNSFAVIRTILHKSPCWQQAG